MMRPHSAFSALIVIAFLLLLTPLTLWLHTGSVDRGLAWAFGLVALAIVVIGLWMYRKSGIVRVVRPYGRTGFGNFLFVLGILLILITITLFLMNYEFTDPLLVGLESEPLRLPGLNKLLPVIGVALMLLGLWVNQSDKYYIRLDHK